MQSRYMYMDIVLLQCSHNGVFKGDVLALSFCGERAFCCTSRLILDRDRLTLLLLLARHADTLNERPLSATHIGVDNDKNYMCTVYSTCNSITYMYCISIYIHV